MLVGPVNVSADLPPSRRFSSSASFWAYLSLSPTCSSLPCICSPPPHSHFSRWCSLVFLLGLLLSSQPLGWCRVAMAGSMGLQAMWLPRSPRSESLRAWVLMLCSCCLEVLKISLSVCLVGEVWWDNRAYPRGLASQFCTISPSSASLGRVFGLLPFDLLHPWVLPSLPPPPLCLLYPCPDCFSSPDLDLSEGVRRVEVNLWHLGERPNRGGCPPYPTPHQCCQQHYSFSGPVG